MNMDKKERKRLAIVFLVVLFLAFFKDVSSGNLQEDNIILRNEYGGAEKDVSLELEIEEANTAQIYVVEVEPMRFTREQANTYFEIAKEEISKDMHTINESLDIKEIYADGMIIAEWQFSPHGYIDSSGDIFWKEIPEEGVLLNVSVLLTGGVYEEIYEFPLLIEGKELSENELIVQDVDKILKQQMQQEGEDKILLPEKIRGKTLIWKEKKDYLTGKVFLLEGILLLLLYILKKREKKELIKKRKETFEYGYPDLINKLCVLLGAGMTMRQAWICIARQYQEKKRKGIQDLLYSRDLFPKPRRRFKAQKVRQGRSRRKL